MFVTPIYKIVNGLLPNIDRSLKERTRYPVLNADIGLYSRRKGDIIREVRIESTNALAPSTYRDEITAVLSKCFHFSSHD
jgi:hypothetical protein